MPATYCINSMPQDAANADAVVRRVLRHHVHRSGSSIATGNSRPRFAATCHAASLSAATGNRSVPGMTCTRLSPAVGTVTSSSIQHVTTAIAVSRVAVVNARHTGSRRRLRDRSISHAADAGTNIVRPTGMSRPKWCSKNSTRRTPLLFACHEKNGKASARAHRDDRRDVFGLAGDSSSVVPEPRFSAIPGHVFQWCFPCVNRTFPAANPGASTLVRS